MYRKLLFFALGYLLSLNAVVHAQTPSSAPSSSTREASKVYPLDAVIDKSGTAWIVDRNKPGVWAYQNNELKLEVQGGQ